MGRIEIFITHILMIIEKCAFAYGVLRKSIKIKKDKKILITAVSIIYIIFLTCFPDKNIIYLICEGMCLCIDIVLFEENYIKSIQLWIMQFVCLGLMESIVYSSEIINTENEFFKVLTCEVIVVLLFAVYYIIIGRKNRELKWNNKMWFMITGVMFVVELMVSYFKALTDVYGDVKWIKIGNVLVVLGGVAIYVLLFSLVHYFEQREEYRLMMEYEEKLNQQQREYFEKMLEKEEGTRQIRHDIINHLIVMQSMQKEEKYTEVDKYMAEMLEEVKILSRKGYDVGNNVINAILNYYLSDKESSYLIKVKGYVSDDIPISRKDMCVIISNLIKNAMEALENVQDKQLEFQVEQGKQYLKIEVMNTYSGERIYDKQGKLVTTKSDNRNHGFGMKNIEKIIKKYDGKKELDDSNEQFKIKIYLKLSN